MEAKQRGGKFGGKKTGKQGAEEGITEDFGPTLAQYSFDSATAR